MATKTWNHLVSSDSYLIPSPLNEGRGFRRGGGYWVENSRKKKMQKFVNFFIEREFSIFNPWKILLATVPPLNSYLMSYFAFLISRAGTARKNLFFLYTFFKCSIYRVFPENGYLSYLCAVVQIDCSLKECTLKELFLWNQPKSWKMYWGFNNLHSDKYLKYLL